MKPGRSIRIRPETRNDVGAITAVNDAAFRQANEGRLVVELRTAEEFDPGLSLVAETEDGMIAGHILFTPVRIVADVDSHQSLALAPMAVLPEFQNQGIGSRLVKTGLAACHAAGHDSVIVLGHPEFYPRFGFKPASEFGIRCPFEGVPDPVFMARELVREALSGVTGVVAYPAPFENP